MELITTTPLPATATTEPEVIRLWIGKQNSGYTRTAYRHDADLFAAHALKPLRAVTLPDLLTFRDYLQGKYKPNTVNRIMYAVRSLLTFAHQIGYLRFNVAAAAGGLEVPARRNLDKRILTEEQVFNLFSAAKPGRDRTIARLLYHTALRVSELVATQWADVSDRKPEGGQVTVYGKGGKTRSILIGGGLYAEVMNLQPSDAMATDHVFRSLRGTAMDESSVFRIISVAGRNAKIGKPVSPHWLRHAHASHALDHNAPLHLISETLGHSSLVTTSRYIHARPNDSSSRYLRGA